LIHGAFALSVIHRDRPNRWQLRASLLVVLQRVLSLEVGLRRVGVLGYGCTFRVISQHLNVVVVYSAAHEIVRNVNGFLRHMLVM